MLVQSNASPATENTRRTSFLSRIVRSIGWERIALALLLVVVIILAFYNLELSPRPWLDEGAVLSVAKSIVRDGVYASRNSDGYQSFGAVQSVGPTVLLPTALSFKLFGVGVWQGRVVAAIYAVLTFVVFYFCALMLFGRRTALLAALLLLAAPAANFLSMGRQVLGQIPAVGLFLAGWLAWAYAIRSNRNRYYVLSGLLFGGAMITKTHYVALGVATMILLSLLDLLYYRQRNYFKLWLVCLIAVACVAGWWLWQYAYYGSTTFLENAAKLGQLTAGTTGFNPLTTVEGLKYIFGPESGHYFYFFGIPALIFVGTTCLRRNQESLITAFLVLFTCLWLAYFVFWSVPLPMYFVPIGTITALFVAKLWHDFLASSSPSWRGIVTEIRQGRPGQLILAVTVVAVFISMIAYPLQGTIRLNVLARDDGPNQVLGPHEVAAYLNATIDQGLIIETWENELTVLTDLTYHFPDSSILAKTQAAAHRGGTWDYSLGEDYFKAHRISYLVVGWVARFFRLYDMDYLNKHAALLTTIGDGFYSYEVYKINHQ